MQYLLLHTNAICFGGLLTYKSFSIFKNEEQFEYIPNIETNII